MTEAMTPEGHDVSRRDFVRTLGTATLASVVPLMGDAPSPVNPPASAGGAVARFYKSLKDEQRVRLCFPFDHPLRGMVNNNWAIVEPRIRDLKAEQRALCNEVFKNLCSEDGHGRFLRQMDEDYGGFENYHVALFGEPGTDKPFEWVLTGRHATLRADGNRSDALASGGPIFYGHAPRAGRTGNVWWDQAEQATAIFKTLNAGQKAQALIPKVKPEGPRPTKFQDALAAAPGLPVGDLDDSRKTLVEGLLKGLLQSFRSPGLEAFRSCLREPGGLDNLRLSYGQKGGPGIDGVGDVWNLEGPEFSWYFHGSPHVHAWVNVAVRASGG